MTKTLILLSLIFIGPLTLAAPALDISNADELLGECHTQEHIGNTGYIVRDVNVSRTADQISFVVPVVNFTCRQSAKSADTFIWVIAAPQKTRDVVNPPSSLTLKNMVGLLYEKELFTPAASDVKTTFRAIETYQLNWLVPGLDQDLSRLQEGESLSREFIFLTKAVYEKAGSDKVFRGFGGKFSLQVTWTKSQGQLSPRLDWTRSL